MTVAKVMDSTPGDKIGAVVGGMADAEVQLVFDFIIHLHFKRAIAVIHLFYFAVADIAEGPAEQARIGGAVHGGDVPDGRHRHRHAVKLPAQHQDRRGGGRRPRAAGGDQPPLRGSPLQCEAEEMLDSQRVELGSGRAKGITNFIAYSELH